MGSKSRTSTVEGQHYKAHAIYNAATGSYSSWKSGLGGKPRRRRTPRPRFDREKASQNRGEKKKRKNRRRAPSGPPKRFGTAPRSGGRKIADTIDGQATRFGSVYDLNMHPTSSRVIEQLRPAVPTSFSLPFVDCAHPVPLFRPSF